MLTALIFGSVVAGTGWCWVKLIAPWVRTHEFHEEVLEIQRELPVPPGQPWPTEVHCTQDLANLAVALRVRSGATIEGEDRTATAPTGGEAQIQRSPR